MAFTTEDPSPILNTTYISDFTPEAFNTLRATFNLADPEITPDAIAFAALNSLSNAEKALAKYHSERNELRAALDVAERDVQHQHQTIDSLQTAVDALKSAVAIRGTTDNPITPSAHTIDLIVRLLGNLAKLDATDPDALEDGLAVIHSLIHSHDDQYPGMSESRSLVLAATQCFSGQLRAWYNSLPIDHAARKSWADLRAHILARFPPGDVQLRSYHKLFELRCESGSDWHRFIIDVQACAKKAKVDDSVVIGHIKTTPGVVPTELSTTLRHLPGAGHTLEEWVAKATAILLEGKLTVASATPATPATNPIRVNTAHVNHDSDDPTPNLACRSHADARDRNLAVYKGKLRQNFLEYRKQHDLCLACGHSPVRHAEMCPAQRASGNV